MSARLFDAFGDLLYESLALLPKGAGHVVQVPNADGTTREVEVQTGLTDGTNTEIVSGLSEGDSVIAAPTVGTQRSINPFGG